MSMVRRGVLRGMWPLVLAWCAVGACKEGVKAGHERGACYGNGTCDQGLICRSKLCVSATPDEHGAGPAPVTTSPAPSPADANAGLRAAVATSPPVAPAPPPRVTSILLDDYGAAAVMACAIDGKLVESAWACSQAMTGDLTVASLAAGTRKLGAPTTLTCEPAPGDVQGKRAGFAIAPAPADAGENPLAELLIWPPSRAADVIRWDTHPTVDLPALTRRATTLARGLKVTEGDQRVPYRLDGAIEVRGTLTADVDGDGHPDVLTSIALPSDQDFWQPHYLLAALSSQPLDLLELSSSTLEEILPLAALDLDGDGTDEVIVSMPYHEGGSSFVGQVKHGKLVSRGGWGCGM